MCAIMKAGNSPKTSYNEEKQGKLFLYILVFFVSK